MQKEYQFGRIDGLRLSVEPLFVAGTMILWLALSATAVAWLNFPFSQAIVGGLIAVFLYWLSEIIHHLGHAFAARKTGHPMTGIRFGTYLFFSTSLYPENEEPLPAGTHIRRAMGGPIASLAFTFIAGAMAWMLQADKGIPGWLVRFVFLINLIVFTAGSFLPLGFTDGSTLLKWWRKR